MNFKQLLGFVKVSQIDLTGASAGTHPASRDFVASSIQASIYGLDMKNSVRAASTGNISLTAPGTAIDGVTLAVNDRILLKNQTLPKENGIYVWTASGATLNRSADANNSANVTSQMAVSVAEGTANKNTTWKLNTPDPLTLGTTDLVFDLHSNSYYATPSIANKFMQAVVTVNDGDLACNTAISATPAKTSYVDVTVGGMQINVGNGVKTTAAYFSGDGGTTARAYNGVVAGDKLYWNGSKAGYQLDTTDDVSFDFVA